MKLIKYITYGLLTLLFSMSIVSFIPKTNVSAKTTEYQATLVEGNAFLPDYSISNVENARVNGDLFCGLTKNNCSFVDLIWFKSNTSIDFDFNTVIVEFDFSNNEFYNTFFGKYFSIYMKTDKKFSLYQHSLGSYSICDWNLNDEFVCNFSNRRLSFFGSNTYYSSNSESLCDFKSDTDCSFEICNLNNTFWGDLYNFINNKKSKMRDFQLIDYVTSFCFLGNNNSLYFNDLSYLRFYTGKLFRDVFNYDFYFDFYNFYIDVYRPVNRINNTLIIYNFDYYNGFYSNITYIEYVLKRGLDYYKIKYGEKNSVADSLPNSNYVCFYNQDVQNIIFDEYITIMMETRKRINFGVSDDNILFVTAGFDFNFVQYNQPLVASNGTYNYNFEKPNYVDMPFSLVPFYIPVLEICQNALIFLIFYCPILSDILSLIHFDKFMSGILAIINFIIKLPLGSFVFACLGFIIYYIVLKMFVPVIYKSYSNTYSVRFSKEKNKIKDRSNYKKYKDKRISDNKELMIRELKIKNNGLSSVRLSEKIGRIYSKKRKK